MRACKCCNCGSVASISLRLFPCLPLRFPPALGAPWSMQKMTVLEAPADWGDCLCAVSPTPSRLITSGSSSVVCVWDLCRTTGATALRLKQVGRPNSSSEIEWRCWGNNLGQHLQRVSRNQRSTSFPSESSVFLFLISPPPSTPPGMHIQKQPFKFFFAIFH